MKRRPGRRPGTFRPVEPPEARLSGLQVAAVAAAAAAVLLYVPLTGVVAPYVRPAFQNGRYIGNATALAVLAAVIGGHFLVTRFRDRRWRARTLAGVLVLDLYQHPAPVSMVVFRCHWPR